MSDNNQDTTSSSDWKNRELGALWRRQGKSQNYLSGTIRIGEFGVEKEYRIVVFTNKGKAKNERAPDFIIYQESPRENAPPSPSDDSEEKNTSPSVDPDLPASLQ